MFFLTLTGALRPNLNYDGLIYLGDVSNRTTIKNKAAIDFDKEIKWQTNS